MSDVAKKRPKPRASVDVMIKRYTKRLNRLKKRKKLRQIKKENAELQSEISEE